MNQMTRDETNPSSLPMILFSILTIQNDWDWWIGLGYGKEIRNL